MKVLVVGGGGREHALAWKLDHSAEVDQVFVAPGNAGTAREPRITNLPIAADDIEALLEFALKEVIDLTIVGPEAPLVAGIVDRFRENRLRCFGPNRAAAQLEGSKAFSKRFMARHGIPTAEYATFTKPDEAEAWIRERGAPIVVKADGLAAGKGVVVAQSVDEAVAAVHDMLEGNAFGDAGHRVVVEEFLQGEEASFIVMADGVHALPLATSQDHKARDDGDTGPNTGGMGAVSPAPVVTPEIERRIMDEVIRPTIDGMAADGNPYTGFLYAGLMIGKDGTPKVLEYNCRFGDPETQPVMMRLRSDLARLCLEALDGDLKDVEARWDDRAAIGVVLAAGGYPADYRKGDAIQGLPEREDGVTKVFHAGTKEDNGQVVTSGGRVLCATALGETIEQARDHAYKLADSIKWDGVYYRRDIGHRAIAHEAKG
ncbi:phosphoribosylamine--glycine ligase [Natronospira bacteriovora]|uniref:Phosphoribosylamine--glycine ligase n=1 Tax=Natronospira bacteriovora TaxID=3069753 RepID=A0ABU0W9I4_9GAMM|nr:phosphoribosylamine--glycine ligase [Natronospira sp. AB-CW4]MDQ2069645.1 phosphoribosylamine--glycine ligase [Natronospira sp. AB-CW4]